ncbi:hypothetical protein NU08_0718 [Flavobacterium anhuiense]|uniref:Uncharacterized protein n=1 Tax=Flavobacterium anhuiense TaxID=459526 RepID=A0A444W2P1_9FLAO|nr:hypothetical protein NU08_0718 [Flavobacterium anhuiense]
MFLPLTLIIFDIELKKNTEKSFHHYSFKIDYYNSFIEL